MDASISIKKLESFLTQRCIDLEALFEKNSLNAIQRKKTINEIFKHFTKCGYNSRGEFKTKLKVNGWWVHKSFKHTPDYGQLDSPEKLTRELARYSKGRTQMRDETLKEIQGKIQKVKNVRDKSSDKEYQFPRRI